LIETEMGGFGPPFCSLKKQLPTMNTPKKIAYHICLWALLTIGYGSLLAEEATGQCVSIFSQYFSEGDLRLISEQRWSACTMMTEKGKSETLFKTDNAEGKTFCRVLKERQEKETLVQWDEMRSSRRMKGENGFLIVPGYPVPCDMLPVEAIKEDGVYAIEQTAGNRSFLRKYRIAVEEIKAAEAIDAGMIQKGILVPKTLRMITVLDDKEKMVLRQLWPIADASWWIYEETGVRKSWRLP
jgi:hypothetical protein